LLAGESFTKARRSKDYEETAVSGQCGNYHSLSSTIHLFPTEGIEAQVVEKDLMELDQEKGGDSL